MTERNNICSINGALAKLYGDVNVLDPAPAPDYQAILADLRAGITFPNAERMLQAIWAIEALLREREDAAASQDQ